MTIQLSPHHQALVEKLVANGAYADASAALERAFQLLSIHEQEMNKLRAELQHARDQIARGEGIEYTDDFWDKLEEEYDEAFQENPDAYASP